MNNEIGRKITSLTLMTIMFAGGLTFAVPGMEPAYAANANLFVSAENSQFDNYMSGPQVIEVVVIDSDINDTDEAKGEPDVTVNGSILRMVQGVDGNWYGYFADRDQAQIADSTVGANPAGSGLDFGTFCSAASAGTYLGVTVTDTDGVAVPANVGGGINGTNPAADITATCDGSGSVGSGISVNGTAMNVLREAKDVNAGSATVGVGQIGINSTSTAIWPFIQLYELNPTGNVVVQYNKGGGAQSTTLTFDTVDQFAGASLDRTVYPKGAQIHATITDLWLNIDPTDEDSWTFGTNSANATSRGAYYQVFNENGGSGGNAIKISSSQRSALMCEDNCILNINPNVQSSTANVLTVQDNADSILVNGNGTSSTASPNNATNFHVAAATAALGEGSVPVTITEQGPNSGVFGTYDESDKSVLKITTDAKRGTSASIDYNETPVTILVGFGFASIDIQPIDDEWSSGEEIPVVIVDSDQNKNSRADEDLDLDNPNVTLIPALRTGDPFTIGEEDSTPSINIFNATRSVLFGSSTAGDMAVGTQANYTLTSFQGANNVSSTAAVDAFSQRAILTQTANATATVGTVIVDLGATMADLRETIQQNGTRNDGVAFNFFNYNVESFGATNNTIFLLNQTAPILTTTGYTAQTSGGLSNAIVLVANGTGQGYVSLDDVDGLFFPSTGGSVTPATQNLGYAIEFDYYGDVNGLRGVTGINDKEVIVADFFSFGFSDDGVQSSERFANQIIRIEAEESGDNTSSFEGSLEYIMVNQINIQDVDTFAGITPIADDPSFIVIEDLTDEDAPRVNI